MGCSFHCIVYDYSCADWDGIHDHLRDVPQENIFKISASAATIEFCEKLRVGLIYRQASNRCKRVLEADKLAYANKTKESITPQKLGSHDFWRIANSVLNRRKSAIPPLFNGPEVWSSTSHKAKLFAENFSKNSNLDDPGISLPVFPCRTNLKLHNISVTSVIMNLDLSKTSGPDCIPVVVLKNCEPELSYILAELFNKCLKESCFPDCWRVS